MLQSFRSTDYLWTNDRLVARMGSLPSVSLSSGNPSTLDSFCREPNCCLANDKSLFFSFTSWLSSDSDTFEFHLCKTNFASLKIFIAEFFSSLAWSTIWPPITKWGCSVMLRQFLVSCSPKLANVVRSLPQKERGACQSKQGTCKSMDLNVSALVQSPVEGGVHHVLFLWSLFVKSLFGCPQIATG